MKVAGRREALESLGSGIYLQGLLLLTGIVAARLLGPDERGQLALLWVVVLTLVQVGMMGTPLAVTYEIAKGRSAITVLRSVLPVGALQMAVIAVTYLVVILTIVHGSVPTAPALVTAAILPVWLGQGYLLAALQGLKEFRALHVLRVLPPSLYAVLLIGGMLLGEDTLLFVTVAWVLGYAMAGVAMLTTFVRLTRGGPADADQKGRAAPGRSGMVRFGLAGFLGSVSPTETFRVDQLVVGLLLSTRDLGLYVAALAFCNLPRFLAQALGLVAFPRVAAANSQSEQRRLLWRFTLVGTAAATAVAVPVILLAAPLVELAFGSDFSPAATTAQILVAGTILLCARRLLSDGLRGVGAPSAGSWAEGISLLALVPALLVFAPTYGLEGVAIALSVTYGISLMTLLIAVRQRGLGWGASA